MSKFTESRHPGEHIVSEANGSRSRESIVINATAGKLAAGTVLGKRTSNNTASVTADGGNTGNGVLGTLSAGNDAITGTYTVTITAAADDAGDFEVKDPFGNVLGTGTVGVAFDEGGLAFTLADGSTDFDVGDTWTIAVVAGKGEWVAYDASGTDDGRRSAAGILYAAVDATTADALAVAHVRDCEVDAAALTGADEAAVSALAALGIILR